MFASTKHLKCPRQFFTVLFRNSTLTKWSLLPLLLKGSRFPPWLCDRLTVAPQHSEALTAVPQHIDRLTARLQHSEDLTAVPLPRGMLQQQPAEPAPAPPLGAPGSVPLPGTRTRTAPRSRSGRPAHKTYKHDAYWHF